MVVEAQIIKSQTPEALPRSDRLGEGTNLLLPMRRVADLLAHFPEEVYNLSPETHLARLLKVLLGEAGVGQLRKRYTMARLQSAIQGSHFYDLDRFYGALFGVHRRVEEVLAFDPYTSTASQDGWDTTRQQDASYRSRVEQFARAIAFCPSPTGMELVAEALLNIDCDVYESFPIADVGRRTYGDLESQFVTYGGMETATYGELEGFDLTTAESQNRWTFTVVPKRVITEEERYDLFRVLYRLKPAMALLQVQPQGIAVHEPVALRGVSADSEHWEIRAQLLPPARRLDIPYLPADWDPSNPHPIDAAAPAFAAYQGEFWTYNGSIRAVTAYTEAPVGTVKPMEQITRVFAGPGQFVDYTPQEAIMPTLAIEAGRAVSDGILVTAPFDGPRQPLQSHPLTTALYTGPSPIDQYVLPSGSSQTTILHRFWPTAARKQSDMTWDVVEVLLDSTKLINHVQFESSRYPHAVAVQAWNLETGAWDIIYLRYITDSVPNVLSPNISGLVHPQHYLANHWVLTKQKVKAVKTNRVRVVMQRWYGQPPVDRFRRPVAYSLAVRNLSVGLRVDTVADLPYSYNPDALTPSVDVFGSQVLHAVHEEKASGLLDPEGQWRSEPQPVPNAVVNLYVDARDADGNSQVLDRFYIDPTHTGVHVSLYHSDEVPDGTFTASDESLPPGVVTPQGNVIVRGNGIDLIGNNAYIEVPNAAIQFDASQGWLFEGEIIPHWPSANATEHTLVAWDGFRLYIANDFIHIDLNGHPDAIAGLGPLHIPAEVRVRCSLYYVPPVDGSDPTFFMRFSYDGQPFEGAYTIAAGWNAGTLGLPSRPTHLRIGGSMVGGRGDFAITSFMLKGNYSADADALDASLLGLPNSVVEPEFRGSDASTLNNAILRFHSAFVTDTNPFGFIGGPPDLYADISWTPVARDYALQKGYLRFPPTLAKFWKFEFTNLAAEPYESFVSIQRKVKVFPVGTVYNTMVPARYGGTTYWPGMTTLLTLAPGVAVSFTDALAAINIFETTDIDPSGRTVASSLFIKDLNSKNADENKRLWWLTGFSPWQQGTLAPRHVEIGPHIYDTVQVRHNEKIGYFVGLKQLEAYRVRYEADDDTPVYYEHFSDMHSISSIGVWTLDPGDLHTEGLSTAIALSKPFLSSHNVNGVQFATQQSDPIQVIPDDSFRDPTLLDYDWEDESTWHKVGDATVHYSASDFTVLVSRNPDDELHVGGHRGGLVQPPDQPPFASGATDIVSSDHNLGGVASLLAPISAAGMVWAATRFTVLTDLTQPIMLEIRGSDGSLLAQKSVMAKKGEVIETFIPYRIGSYDPGFVPGEFAPRTIVDRPLQPTTTDPALSLSSPPTPPSDVDNVLSVRLVQYGQTLDSWKIDALSLFDESIVWEFSNDGGTTWIDASGLRNNPNGVLMFVYPGSSLRWRVTAYRDNLHVSALQIRPWYESRLSLRTAGPHRGPNYSTFDQEPPIQDDPEFNQWFKPVPRSWFLEGKRYPKVSPPGAPPTTEQSRFFGRNAADAVTAPADAATRVGIFARYGYSTFDAGVSPHEIPGEFVAEPTDVATRGNSIFYRTASESVTITDSALAVVFKTTDDPINRRPISPL